MYSILLENEYRPKKWELQPHVGFNHFHLIDMYLNFVTHVLGKHDKMYIYAPEEKDTSVIAESFYFIDNSNQDINNDKNIQFFLVYKMSKDDFNKKDYEKLRLISIHVFNNDGQQFIVDKTNLFSMTFSQVTAFLQQKDHTIKKDISVLENKKSIVSAKYGILIHKKENEDSINYITAAGRKFFT